MDAISQLLLFVGNNNLSLSAFQTIAFKVLCDDNKKQWNTLQLHYKPKTIYNFCHFEVRFCNYLQLNEKNEATSKDSSKGDLMSTCDKVLDFYKLIFKEDDETWTKFDEFMQSSCTIVVFESYPNSQDPRFERVIAAATFGMMTPTSSSI